MNSMPLISLFLQGIPESICLYALFFVLLRLKLEWLKIIPLGVLMAITAYLVRLLPLIPGEPTIILIVIGSIAVGFVDKQHSYVKVLFAVVIGTAILAVFEALLFPLSLQLLHTTVEDGKRHPLLWSLAGLTHVAAVFILIAAIDFYNHRLGKKKNDALLQDS